MANPYVNKIQLSNGTTLMDLTGDTVTSSDLLTGVTAHDRSGAVVTGSLSDFTGDSGSGGTHGLVPAPAAGDSGRYLKGNGTWAAAPVTSVNSQTGAVSLTIPSVSTATATLSSSSWASTPLTQSVTVSGVTSSNTVVVSPAPSSMDTWQESGIKCTAQATNSLTFTADSAPSANITVNVMILS